LTEVVSVAALIHDLGHVPFGHTLEDEYSGLFKRHDSVAGSRLYQMLFDQDSELAAVFSEAAPQWLDYISNETLRKVIYVLLSWKEHVDGPASFEAILDDEAGRLLHGSTEHFRIDQLREWYRELGEDKLFHPFMSDVVGNTICADLLDYLPRDRYNLGLEARFHQRLQRYLTIKPGTFYENEGLRVCIVVRRRGRGGQRRDVATSVLDIMRERYEMAERVYYHHKKAAASAMLVRLYELVSEQHKPHDTTIYPAPWQLDRTGEKPPHMVHLGDADLIDYLGAAPADDRALQHRLFTALRYHRRGIYRTLLVIDTDLVNHSKHPLTYILERLRGSTAEPTSEGRRDLERFAAISAGASDGQVIIYCPSAGMQAKEVNVRVEIQEGRVMPLRVQREWFAYHSDLEVLERYYQELWRAYVFVDPEIFDDHARCQAIVDHVCEALELPKDEAYRKVRNHEFVAAVDVQAGLREVREFISKLPVHGVPTAVTLKLMESAESDGPFVKLAGTPSDSSAKIEQRLSALFDHVVLSDALETSELSDIDSARLRTYSEQLAQGFRPVRSAARGKKNSVDYAEYRKEVVTAALSTGDQQLDLE
jgi:HD superfamily phosphohydrolase